CMRFPSASLLCPFSARFRAASLRDPLVSASTVVSAMALLLSASSDSQRPSRLTSFAQGGPAGAMTALAAEASFRSGSFLALDCKASSLHGSKALHCRIRSFLLVRQFLLWLCCSALR